MKKRTLFRLFALLLTIVMLVSSLAIAVGAEEASKEDVQNNDTESSGEKYLREDCWYIAYKNTTTYSLVRSRKAMNLVKARILQLQQDLKKWTAADPTAEIDPVNDFKLGPDAGADLDLIIDASQLTNQEIVIGQTGSIGRADMEARAVELGIESADFFIEVKEDGDVWIVGGSNTATTVAIDFFLERACELDIKERYLRVKKGYSYVYHNEPKTDLPASEEAARGADAFEFVVVPATMQDVYTRLTYETVGGWRIKNKYSFTKDYNDYGAAQTLALSLGELPDVSAKALVYEDLENGVKISAPDGSYVIYYADPFLLEFYSASGVLAQTVNALSYEKAANGSITAGITVALEEGMPIYGGGQRFDTVNLNPEGGKRVVLYSTDVWEETKDKDGNVTGYQDSNERSQITVPLFTNVRGSGVFINRNEYMVADIGKNDPTKMNFFVTDGEIDFYVFTTESIADSIGKYCEISGASSMPEEWTYGMIVCRAYPDFSDLDKVYKIIAKMEHYSLPWTGITIQGWSVYSGAADLELKALCEHVHSLGKKVIVSVSVGDFPGAEEMDATIREEAALPADQKPEIPAPDYFMGYKSASGKVHTFVDSVGATQKDKKIPDCLPDMLALEIIDSEKLHANNLSAARYYLDITNPEAVAWFFGEYWESLINEIGVDGVKLDGGYRIPDTAGTISMYDTDRATAGTHHWYPTAFSGMIWNMIAAKPDSGVCFVRGAGIGAQRLSYVAVADQTRILNRLQRQVTSMITAGLSGISFTTFDIGGTRYKDGSLAIKDDAPIFLRSLQVAAFSVCMQTAGEGTLNAYEYAEYEDETGAHPYAYVTNLYKIYSMLHEALTPYLNEQSEIACETGMPVVRHLVLQYANDANVYDIKDEYMLGDAFLVAPVVPDRIANNTKRTVYLPEGEWLDLLSGETVSSPEGGMDYKEYSKKGALTQGQIPVFYNLNNQSEVAPEIYAEVQELLGYASAVEITG